MVFRPLNWLMAALFAFAVVVQLNDPDPAIWIAVYGAAALVAAMTARKGQPPRVAAGLVGVVALAWGTWLALGIPAGNVYARMFDAWEMTSAPIEEARETIGLFIVAAWMGVLGLRRR
jgi:hypothetical protein